MTKGGKRRKHRSYSRRVATRRPEKTFLIICEGTKTEPNYLKSFRVLSANVEIIGTARNTMSLVYYAQEMLAERPDEFDEIWLVFDKDSFSRRNFNNAVFFCESHYEEGFRVAYSNEAFELWYLLHYDAVKKPLSRFRYAEFLSQRLGSSYRKNDPHMYRKLRERQPIAIENARRLFANRSNSPARDNPSTTVFQLVEELNRHLKE